MEDIPIEYELLRDVPALDLQVVKTEIDEVGESHAVRIEMQEDPEILETCAFSLVYAIGALSFHDARPRGVSGVHYQEEDDWTVADMIRHLRFRRGWIHCYVDYVRGRCVKTDVDIAADGRIVLKTTNRGVAATRWVARLQGKRLLSVVGKDARIAD
jgi:hypothetical protein